ncbi:MAG: hypothetical protein ABJO27_11630 [Pseudoruegeria sp.]
MLINLDQVPASACLAEEDLSLTDVVSNIGGHWFSSEPILTDALEGVVQGLRSRTSELVARPANGNDGICQLVPFAGQPFLAFEDGKNCGFTIKSEQSCARISMVLCFGTPTPTSGTLASILSQGAQQTLSLRGDDGVLQVGNRKGQPSLNIPIEPKPKVHTVCLTQDSKGVRVAVDNGLECFLEWSDGFEPGAVTSFIACRRDQAGLYKTQGPAHIADMLLLPDFDLFSARGRRLRKRMNQYVQEVFSVDV